MIKLEVTKKNGMRLTSLNALRRLLETFFSDSDQKWLQNRTDFRRGGVKKHRNPPADALIQALFRRNLNI